MVVSSLIKVMELYAFTLKCSVMIDILTWILFESFIDLAGFGQTFKTLLVLLSIQVAET